MQNPTTNTAPVDPRSFKTFAEFYPFYLTEHSNRTCRRLHFVGSSLALVCIAMLIATGKPQYLLYGLLCGYGFAWVGHFGFEKNKPASFKRPLLSFSARHYAHDFNFKIQVTVGGDIDFSGLGIALILCPVCFRSRNMEPIFAALLYFRQAFSKSRDRPIKLERHTVGQDTRDGKYGLVRRAIKLLAVGQFANVFDENQIVLGWGPAAACANGCNIDAFGQAGPDQTG